MMRGIALLAVFALAFAPHQETVTLRAARVFDGRGRILPNAVIEIQGSRITRIDQRKGPVTHDLGGVTLMPGLIDVHVHLDWHFGPDGRYGNRPDAPRETPEQRQAAIYENARQTLMAGFTTVQSLGSPIDKELRAAFAAGTVPGPRLLSSLGQINPRASDTPGALRERVRQAKANGADVIKLFASGSIRDGGKMSVTQEQIDAVCGEAKAQGLRTLVHAHDSQSIVAAVNGGCTQIEHGAYADDAAIAAMKKADVYFDPNIGLVLQNYIENKTRYMGTGNYNEEGFAFMERAVSTLPPIFNKALKAGVKMPMGTDAVAGAHGQNARELFVRVRDGGQKPMDALISATSLAAESFGLGGTIGTLAAGYEADIIAAAGDPSRDITALKNIRFVMKGGRVIK